MYEKVNPSHPDKLADRIAGAIVDLAYSKQENPKIAVEVLNAGYNCSIVIETDAEITRNEVTQITQRISPSSAHVFVQIRPQDKHLAENQAAEIKCGDNGIFKGTPVTEEQKKLTQIARDIYEQHPTDGKYLLDGERLIICQSNAKREELAARYPEAEINPIGDWSGGPDVDTGATNRKLGSDLGDAVTGGGIHGKDLSKADVSITIYAHLKAQEQHKPVEFSCAIGDTEINGIPFAEIVETAKEYVHELGGFEKLAEWGLITPSPK